MVERIRLRANVRVSHCDVSSRVSYVPLPAAALSLVLTYSILYTVNKSDIRYAHKID